MCEGQVQRPLNVTYTSGRQRAPVPCPQRTGDSAESRRSCALTLRIRPRSGLCWAPPATARVTSRPAPASHVLTRFLRGLPGATAPVRPRGARPRTGCGHNGLAAGLNTDGAFESSPVFDTEDNPPGPNWKRVGVETPDLARTFCQLTCKTQNPRFSTQFRDGPQNVLCRDLNTFRRHLCSR